MVGTLVSNYFDSPPHGPYDTAKNPVISPNFMVWKFCGKAQFPHSFGRIARNFRVLIQKYAQFRVFGKGSRTSFSTTFYVWFFKKNVSHGIFY